jgi:hypothetical protein
MIVMPANNSKWQVHYWQGKYGGLGHLYSLGSQRGPYQHLPYALDNGRFPCYSTGKEWKIEEYRKLLAFAAEAQQKPMWALVPDVVTDPVKTLEEWREYAPVVRFHLPSVPLAFAAQDGHTVRDIPEDADVVFLGGSTEWKRANIATFCSAFKRVHIGRINTYKWLRVCADSGAESCDGTGWFRGDKEQLAGLERFLQEQHGGRTVTQQTIDFAAARDAVSK